MSIGERIGGAWKNAKDMVKDPSLLAAKLDEGLFKTESKARARAAMDDPEFRGRLDLAVKKGQLNREALRDPNDPEVLKMHKSFERSNVCVERATKLLQEQTKEALGVDLPPEAAEALKKYYEDASVTDPKTIERQFKVFEKGEKLRATMEAAEKEAASLEQMLGGKERAQLLHIHDRLQFKGWKEVFSPFKRASERLAAEKGLDSFLRQEAKKLGYGPFRGFLYRTFGGMKKLEAKIQEGSTGASLETERKSVQALKTAQERGASAKEYMESRRDQALQDVSALHEVYAYARQKAMEKAMTATVGGLMSGKRSDLIEARQAISQAKTDKIPEGVSAADRANMEAMRIDIDDALEDEVSAALAEATKNVAEGHERFSSLVSVAESSVEDLEKAGFGSEEAKAFVVDRLEEHLDGLQAAFDALPPGDPERDPNRAKRTMLSLLISQL
jgi:hypothetical protein